MKVLMRFPFKRVSPERHVFSKILPSKAGPSIRGDGSSFPDRLSPLLPWIGEPSEEDFTPPFPEPILSGGAKKGMDICPQKG